MPGFYRKRTSQSYGMTFKGRSLRGEEETQDVATFGAGQAGWVPAFEGVDEVAGGVDEAQFPAGRQVIEGARSVLATEDERWRAG